VSWWCPGELDSIASGTLVIQERTLASDTQILCTMKQERGDKQRERGRWNKTATKGREKRQTSTSYAQGSSWPKGEQLELSKIKGKTNKGGSTGPISEKRQGSTTEATTDGEADFRINGHCFSKKADIREKQKQHGENSPNGTTKWKCYYSITHSSIIWGWHDDWGRKKGSPWGNSLGVNETKKKQARRSEDQSADARGFSGGGGKREW